MILRITKEEFCDFVKAFQEYEDMLRNTQYVTGINFIESAFDDFSGKMYNIIHSIFDFSEDEITALYGSDLDYFIWELDFGRKWEPGMVEQDGVDLDWSSAEKFYDWIVKDREGLNENL